MYVFVFRFSKHSKLAPWKYFRLTLSVEPTDIVAATDFPSRLKLLWLRYLPFTLPLEKFNILKIDVYDCKMILAINRVYLCKRH
jgi:hypothetical protein